MAWTLLLLTLIYCPGVSSQDSYTQPPSESVSPGSTVRLSCTLTSAHSSYVIEWYQQRDGQAPRLMIYHDSSRADGTPDRFTGSRSGSNRYLTISNAQPEDEATYYCGAGGSSGINR
uniref:Ig-like domain-containing protein n=1 Tax=Sphenodon punctatus TaxID=8508 RepID=A0A8D0H058_SPHPU